MTILFTLLISNTVQNRQPTSPQNQSTTPTTPTTTPSSYSTTNDPTIEIYDAHSTDRWHLPDQWKQDIVFAIPMSPAGLDWVKTSRSWRRGARAAYVGDVVPTQNMLNDGTLHGESYVFLNASDVPFHYYGKAAMVPSMAHEHFVSVVDDDDGSSNDNTTTDNNNSLYKWMLYGDDDTVWFMDRVIDIVQTLDPELPWFLSDHMWFWGYKDAIYKKVNHPAADAPRCVPCGFNLKSKLTGKGDQSQLPFEPPEACPYCTWDLLCQHDTNRTSVYQQPTEKERAQGKKCGFKRKYPQEGEYLVHGGGGIILSIGLMKLLSVDYMMTCIKEQFKPNQVFGGDTLFSHCTFLRNIAPTDPGYFFLNAPYNTFDQGGQLVLPIMDEMYRYLKKGECCDAKCRERIGNLTTVHMRGMHFKEAEAAQDMARMVVRMREMYLHVREKGGRNGGHPGLEPGWDVHKACY
jgi:hypothetical protein